MLEINKTYSLNDNIIIKGINNKFWALDTKSGSQFKLNEISFDILSELDGKTTIKNIISNQLKKYDVSEEVLTKDILSFLEYVYLKGFISISKL